MFLPGFAPKFTLSILGESADILCYNFQIYLKLGFSHNNTWQEANNISFNGIKFQTLRYDKNTELKQNSIYFTPGMDAVIEEKDSLGDLGVIVSSLASFHGHI